MTKNRIKIDEAALRRAIQPQLDNAQQALTQQLQATVREVNDEMSGQPSDQIYDTLVTRLRNQIPGFKVNEQEMRRVAAEIEAGTLT